MFLSSIFLIIGLAILILGGEIFVRGSSSIAKKLKISSIVIGLTIVSFGTSAPELIVNILSATRGATDLALGNILGSNISNILLVLGISAIVYPLTVKENTTWKEIPFGVLSTIILLIISADIFLNKTAENFLTRGDGLILICFFVIFIVYTYGLTKIEADKDVVEEVSKYNWSKSIFFIIFGILFLALGGHLIVENATKLARIAGLSELFIGLTITAIGTSLPELVTSVIAAYRKQIGLAIGNVIGSNIFNILWVLGITSFITPIKVNEHVFFDILMALLVSLLLFIIMFIGGKRNRHKITRTDGFIFVALYILYIVTITLRG